MFCPAIQLTLSSSLQEPGAGYPKLLQPIRRKIILTTSYILFTLLLRLAFAVFASFGVVYDINNLNAPTATALINCPLCDQSCSSGATVAATFLTFTPELHVTNNLISVPLALLIGLWYELAQPPASQAALKLIVTIILLRSTGE